MNRYEINFFGRHCKAQQEMVGFVLIVVIVMVALMTFLVISVKSNQINTESAIAKNMVYSILNYQTNCAISYEPDYDSIEDLIKSCYENEECSNLKQNACEILNETLLDIMEKLMQTESQYSSYKLIIYLQGPNESLEPLLKIQKGNLNGSSIGAGYSIIHEDGKINVEIMLFS